MNTYTLDWKRYVSLARQATAEGCVLLKNDENVLPLTAGTKISVFGRIQLHYYKSGTGSGGMVNVDYVNGVLEGLSASGQVQINETLLNIYREWEKTHPFDGGHGWGTEPWAQTEMPLTDEIAKDAAGVSDTALVIIGRTAGEDQDNTPEPGSYCLTETEEEMLRTVRKHFSKMAVLINAGNIIDMTWVETFCPDAVMYIWQGGMEGGMGAADVLTGKVSPCGKLADTIARSITDYPSHKNFGDPDQNIYEEDIYVGYRYFQTFAPEAVLYPFGYGLSYTTFDICTEMAEKVDSVLFHTTITNTGNFPGKEVVQIYCNPPQGLLGKPVRNLAAFSKTKELMPGESQTLLLTVKKADLASFDDSGITGHAFCRVLEPGTYEFYTGNNVQDAVCTGSFQMNNALVTEKLHQAMAPVLPFQRIRPVSGFSETVGAPLSVSFESVPRRTEKNILSCPSVPEADAGVNKGILLSDVKNGKVSMAEFLSQLTDADLCHIVLGEGMCSPKVTPGTAAAFGGVTDRLQGFGIPAGCCTDGPSGMRRDNGSHAFSLPNGTLLACTFHPALVADLFEMEGLEMRANNVDALLGPGINIHRYPLNGRNFEYHSEDPYLTGIMACAQLEGLKRAGVSGTIKHFCANNQEAYRTKCNSVVSQRALREIYLRPYEIAVKGGNADSVMTTYGGVNGIWTAGNYDQNTLILREEWGFQGIVMTDWWAQMNEEGETPTVHNIASMVQSQNDLYMVTSDSTAYESNLPEALENGKVSRSELLRCASNICRFLMHTPAMERMMKEENPVEIINKPDNVDTADHVAMEYVQVSSGTTISLEDFDTSKGTHPLMAIHLDSEGVYKLTLTASVEGSRLAQVSASLLSNGSSLTVFFFQGADGEKIDTEQECTLFGRTHYMSMYFAQNGLKLHEIKFEKIKDIPLRA